MSQSGQEILGPSVTKIEPVATGAPSGGPGGTALGLCIEPRVGELLRLTRPRRVDLARCGSGTRTFSCDSMTCDCVRSVWPDLRTNVPSVLTASGSLPASGGT